MDAWKQPLRHLNDSAIMLMNTDELIDAFANPWRYNDDTNRRINFAKLDREGTMLHYDGVIVDDAPVDVDTASPVPYRLVDDESDAPALPSAFVVIRRWNGLDGWEPVSAHVDNKAAQEAATALNVVLGNSATYRVAEYAPLPF